MRGVRNLGEIQGSNFSSIAGFGFKVSLVKNERFFQKEMFEGGYLSSY